MKIARVSTLTAVTWIGLFAGSTAVAQQIHPTLGTVSPEKTALEPIPEGSTDTPSDTILGETDPLVTYETVPQGASGEGCSTGCSTGGCLDDGTYGVCAFGPNCAVCGGGSSSPPSWYIQQHIRFWTRSRPRRHELTSKFDVKSFTTGDTDPISGQALRQNFRIVQRLASTRSVNFNPEPGWDMVIGHYLGRDAENRDLFLEFGYSGLMSWDESLQLEGVTQPIYTFELLNPSVNPPSVISPGVFSQAISDPYLPGQFPRISLYGGSLLGPFREATGRDFQLGLATPTEVLLNTAFNRADRHTQIHVSDFGSYELNLRIRPRGRGDRLVMQPNGKWQRECNPGEYVSYLFGMRLLTVDEKFRFLSRGSRQDANRRIVSLASGEYRIRTHNDMIGLQFGGDWVFRECKWTYGIRAKMGPFLNFTGKDARLHATTSDFTGEVPVVTEQTLRATGRKNGAALLGEFGFTTTYKLNPRLTLQASYDFMWLVGLALAPEQLLFKEAIVSEVNDNGHIYYHGLTLGAEYAF